VKYRFIRVGKTKSYGFYQNASIDLEVELEKDEQPELIVKQLDEEVEKLLGQIVQSEEITEVREDIKQLEERRNELQNEVDKLSDEVDSKKELLSRLATIATLIKDIESKEVNE